MFPTFLEKRKKNSGGLYGRGVLTPPMCVTTIVEKKEKKKKGFVLFNKNQTETHRFGLGGGWG